MILQRIPGALLLACLARPALPLTARPGQDGPFRLQIADAEAALRDGEFEIAESRYRDALLEGWLLSGSLALVEGRLDEARTAFERAATSTLEVHRAHSALALVMLQEGALTDAIATLRQVVAGHPRDLESRLLLAQALAAHGQPELAIQELEEARASAPDDPELAYALGSGYLRVGRTEDADRLFAEVLAARPVPEARVLVGRTYSDLGFFGEARRHLRAALSAAPGLRRAHYHLGMNALREQGVLRLDEAIRELRLELAISPDDAAATLSLGIALTLARRFGEALPLLERAVRTTAPRSAAWHYLGRCQSALDRSDLAVSSLERALDLALAESRDESQLASIHYQLALALRRGGDPTRAAEHFSRAEALSAREAESARELLARYLDDQPDPRLASQAARARIESSPLAALSGDDRAALKQGVAAGLARAYSNLGVMHARSGRHARAASLFEAAGLVDPRFPAVQYALGTALFNAGRRAEAAEPLARAASERPDDLELKRMLAMAWLESGDFHRAADLLRDDPQRHSNPALQYSLGLALVRDGRLDEARSVLARLVSDHGDSAAVNVLLGQAHFREGSYELAIDRLRHALRLDANVREANATLGLIHLRQGRLGEAEKAFRAELSRSPLDYETRHRLAAVLDLQARAPEALAELRSVLLAQPDFSRARYLLGKVLLGQGDVSGALLHLEAAARIAPDEASVRYQLARAYQKLGRREQAAEQFERYRTLKEGSRDEP